MFSAFVWTPQINELNKRMSAIEGLLNRLEEKMSPADKVTRENISSKSLPLRASYFDGHPRPSSPQSPAFSSLPSPLLLISLHIRCPSTAISIFRPIKIFLSLWLMLLFTLRLLLCPSCNSLRQLSSPLLRILDSKHSKELPHFRRPHLRLATDLTSSVNLSIIIASSKGLRPDP